GYLKKDLERDPKRLDFYHYSLEGSRPFRGLKLWFTLQTLGRRGLGDLVDRTMETALQIERQVRRLDCFELHPAPVELGSVCFRYLPPWARRRPSGPRMRRAARGRLDRAQVAIQQQIEKTGRAWFPVILLSRGIYFRLGVFNYRTGADDVEATLRLIREAAMGLKLG
ncbi:MAG: pyridoxal-dependent decarboxylase, partial [Acidobacteria bacterium]|nr:pyridoxal-dependent decarboxylase [Acidobacteriota bacterium]